MAELTTRELLVRIDERQQRIMEDISEMKDVLRGKVTNDSEYQEMKEKVDTLWDWRTKLVAQIAILVAIVGAFFGMLGDWIYKKLFGG